MGAQSHQIAVTRHGHRLEFTLVPRTGAIELRTDSGGRPPQPRTPVPTQEAHHQDPNGTRRSGLNFPLLDATGSIGQPRLREDDLNPRLLQYTAREITGRTAEFPHTYQLKDHRRPCAPSTPKKEGRGPMHRRHYVMLAVAAAMTLTITTVATAGALR